MIVVTHLLGTGHLARVLTLARAYLTKGHDVQVVSGGMPAPLLDRGDVPICQLPPLRSDGVDFTRLLTDQNALASEKFLADRLEKLLQVLNDFAPDILITELFPFGRRNLRAEFQALLAAAKSLNHPPLICASIRDILAPPSKPKKAAFADDLIDRFYDVVLVHSDPTVTPLETSWPVSSALQKKLHYTGFVAPATAGPHPDLCGTDQIIVSTGGSSVGLHVYQVAMQAAKLDPSLHWRLLIGGKDAAQTVTELSAQHLENVTIEAARPDFRQMLYHAKASVSLCGYNTALDILQAGTPAVFVPFDAGQEVEQSLRTSALQKLDGIGLVKASDLTAERLLLEIQKVTSAPGRARRTDGLDGAAQTVAITQGLVAQ